MSEAAQQIWVSRTAMGFCAIAWSDAGVAAFQLPTKNAESAERLIRRRTFGAEPGRAAGRRCGRRRGGETLLRRRGNGLLAGSARPRRPGRVLRATPRPGRVGWGRTTTYGALAKDVGAGRERARDVGEAMARNPTPLIIPCHRVLASAARSAVSSRPAARKQRPACSNWRAFASARRKPRSRLSVSERTSSPSHRGQS